MMEPFSTTDFDQDDAESMTLAEFLKDGADENIKKACWMAGLDDGLIISTNTVDSDDIEHLRKNSRLVSQLDESTAVYMTLYDSKLFVYHVENGCEALYL